MFDYQPSVAGHDLPVDRQFALAQAEFRDVAATVRVVDLDPHFLRPGEDSPFVVRPFVERALVVELNDLGSLCRYASVSGRAVTLMEASAWESTDEGATLLLYRVFASCDGHCGPIEEC